MRRESDGPGLDCLDCLTVHGLSAAVGLAHQNLKGGAGNWRGHGRLPRAGSVRRGSGSWSKGIEGEIKAGRARGTGRGCARRCGGTVPPMVSWCCRPRCGHRLRSQGVFVVNSSSPLVRWANVSTAYHHGHKKQFILHTRAAHIRPQQYGWQGTGRQRL